MLSKKVSQFVLRYDALKFIEQQGIECHSDKWNLFKVVNDEYRKITYFLWNGEPTKKDIEVTKTKPGENLLN